MDFFSGQVSLMRKNTSGFTLIEVSIVLVIIGLLVSGALVGVDLIKRAEVRSFVAQVEKYQAAVNTFRVKYNGLPGDIAAVSASRFGMQARSGLPGQGDGNNVWEGCSASAVGTSTVFGCETALVWRDLSFSNLIDASFASATDALTEVVPGDRPLYFPQLKLGTANYLTALSINGRNFFFISGIASTDSSGVYSLQTNMNALDAYSVDSKLDDGRPTQGKTIAASNLTTVGGSTDALTGVTAACVKSTTGDGSYTPTQCADGASCYPGAIYDTASANTLVNNCQLLTLAM